MKRILLLITFSLTLIMGYAQMMDPVHFKSELKPLKGAEAELIFSATIDPGWHVYSTGLGDDGPISASFHAQKMEGAELVGKLQARGNEIKQYDKLFEMNLRYFEKAVTFVQKIRFTKPKYDIDCYIEYGACNDESCLPPSEAELKVSGVSPKAEEPKAEEPKVEEPKAVVTDEVKNSGEETDSLASDSTSLTSSLSPLTSDLWAPIVDDLKAMGGSDNIANDPLVVIQFFFDGFRIIHGGFLLFHFPSFKKFWYKKTSFIKNEAFSGPSEIRTHDLLNAIETRSQLRYRPIILLLP